MVPLSDIEEARKLLNHAESEVDPARKLAALEEGIDLLESSSENPELAKNLRHSSIRRLLKQLVDMRNIQEGVWFDYIHLLLLRLDADVKLILDEDPALKQGYTAFISTWKDELLDVLQRDKNAL